MCASFGQFYSPMGDYKIDFGGYKLALNRELNKRYFPYQKAEVIKYENKEPVFTQMSFSLVPRWSKEPKVKFATHNARIESVMEKPTWKAPFLKNHCLIPMTNFYESITLKGKEHAGHMVNFYEKYNRLLLAAGMFDWWANKETGETTASFTILTSEPPGFIKRIGHDRCPIFLKESDGLKWLRMEESGADMLRFLKTSKIIPKLDVKIDRPLKDGWEKR